MDYFSIENINQIKNKVIAARFQIFTNITLFCFYYFICTYTPYAADDYHYKINSEEYKLTLSTFKDLFDFQLMHYLNWGGRIIVMFFIQLFLIPSKIIFNVVNALIQVLLINTIFYYAFHKIARNRHDSFFLFLINNVIFLSFYQYSGVSMYITPTINYSWMHLLVLLYYLPYLNFYLKGYDKFKFPLLLGIIVGCTNEHIFFAQLSVFFGLYFLHRYKGLKIPGYFYKSLIGVLIGGLILIAAPGNFIRAKTVSFDLSYESIINYLTYDINWLIVGIKPLWLLFIPIVLTYIILGGKLKWRNSTLFVLFTGTVSSLAMSFSPSFHNLTNLFFFFTLIIFLFSLFDIGKIGKWPFLSVIFSTYALFLYLLHHHLLINNHAKKIEEFIIEQKGKGNFEIIVKSYPYKINRLIHYNDITRYKNYPRNVHIAKYYGLKSIQTTDN